MSEVDVRRPFGRITRLFLRGVHLEFVLTIAKTFVILAAAMAVKLAYQMRDQIALGRWKSAAAARNCDYEDYDYEDCAPGDRLMGQCCL